jgi:ribosome maturation factor RimP
LFWGLTKVAGATQEVLERLIAPTVEAMGYSLVRVRLGGSPRRLQVMAERSDGTAMTVDGCAALSKALSALLDVEDPIEGAYALEVSSPGIDRPLVRLADFDRFAGFEAKIVTGAPVDGRHRFRGRLLGTDSAAVQIDVGGEVGVAAVPFDAIRDAKLVLTDELIAATLNTGNGG